MLQLFKYQEKEIRFVGTSDAPEWVANDVLDILHPDLDKSNRKNVLKKIPSEWLGGTKIMTRSGNGTEQGRQVKTLLEPGLYWLIARSNSEMALPFQKWLFEEVIPSIRKAGAYGQPQAPALQPTESPENKATLEALSTVAQTMITSGVSASIAHQWQIEQIGKVLPGLQAGLKAAGAIISAANPANPLPINCNEIGRRVGKHLSLEPAPSAIKINKALEKIGMQRRDEVASKWRLTEAGEKYGDLQSTVVNGYTREHIRWYDEVIELLVPEFTPENTPKQ
jgi:prophage antirepressor-like protein